MVRPILIERTIAAPPEAVFAVSTDVPSWPEIVPAIDKTELLTPGPVGLGTRFRETRTMFGREATEEMEFLEFEPSTRYVLGAMSHGCRYRTTFRLTPVEGGTRLSMEFGAEPLTFFAKVMSVAMAPMRKKIGEMCGRDLDAMKAHLEARGSATQPAAGQSEAESPT
ncbi:MAG: SRPBCC family protein [Planctomycetota bacterium]